MSEVCSVEDRDILRALAEAYATCSQEKVNKERAELWAATNELKPVKVPVFINELPWHEMNFQGELNLHCQSELAKKQEGRLR